MINKNALLTFRSVSNVKRAISRADVSDANHDHVDQGPNAQATKAEELANAFLPMTKVKPEMERKVEGSRYPEFRHIKL